MRAPRPATPASSKSPPTAASPSSTGTCATISFFVFVLWMRTRVTPSVARTSPSRWVNAQLEDLEGAATRRPSRLR